AGGVGPLINYDASRLSVESLALTERALAALPTDDDAARARVLAAHAFWVHRTNSPDAPSLSDAAIDAARDLGDDVILAETIATVIHAYMRPADAAAMRARTDELGGLIERTGLVDLRGPYLWGRTFELIRSGRLDEWEAVIDELEEAARDVGWVTGRWLAAHQRVVLAHTRGEVLEPLAQIDGLYALGEELGVPPGFVGGYLGTIHALLIEDSGDPEGYVEVARSMAERFPAIAELWQNGAASALCLAGRLDEARLLYEPIRDAGFVGLRFNAMVDMCLGQAAVTACFLGDGPGGAEIHRQLEPYSGMVTWTLTLVHGPVDLYLAHASVACGEDERAHREFAAAEALRERAGMPGWQARVWSSQAQLHLRQGSSEEAAASARRAHEAAVENGWGLVAHQAQAVLDQL
ncbi:MAG: hypothetical protein AAGK32_09250, partial [Actinomycetota bacterium]